MPLGIVWGPIQPDVRGVILLRSPQARNEAPDAGKTADPVAVASAIAFLAMTVYDLTGPPGDQWLLVYAVVGLPFLILILFLPLVNRGIIYSIPTTRN